MIHNDEWAGDKKVFFLQCTTALQGVRVRAGGLREPKQELRPEFQRQPLSKGDLSQAKAWVPAAASQEDLS